METITYICGLDVWTQFSIATVADRSTVILWLLWLGVAIRAINKSVYLQGSSEDELRFRYWLSQKTSIMEKLSQIPKWERSKEGLDTYKKTALDISKLNEEFKLRFPDPVEE